MADHDPKQWRIISEKNSFNTPTFFCLFCLTGKICKTKWKFGVWSFSARIVYHFSNVRLIWSFCNINSPYFLRFSASHFNCCYLCFMPFLLEMPFFSCEKLLFFCLSPFSLCSLHLLRLMSPSVDATWKIYNFLLEFTVRSLESRGRAEREKFLSAS